MIFCREIQYKIEANILKSGICHCRDCQLLTGGMAWSFIVIPQESLVIQGETKEFTRPGASGKPVHVSFCGTCGSTLFGRPEIWPHIRIVGASSLDDKTLFTPDICMFGLKKHPNGLYLILRSQNLIAVRFRW